MLKFLAVLILLLIAVWLFAPREPVDTAIAFDAASIGTDVDAYLAKAEAEVKDLRDGVAKRVVWAGEPGQKTPLSIVYLHGFSATSEEIRPVPDNVARALGANLYFARLAGHGRTGDAMAEPTAGDWIEDTAEALAIGRQIGEEVVVLSTSTGGTLSAIAANDPALAENVKAMVMLSPNFGVNHPASALLTFPFVRHWLPLILGKERSFTPQNIEQAKFWTTAYPSVAVFPMAALVDYAVGLDYSEVTTPALFLLSDDDSVVRPDIARLVAARWGPGAEVREVTLAQGDDPYSHVIAGDILSPAQTGPVSQAIVKWIQGL
ncbi:alpha/beta hydrolase [Actibacterium lipolyticum]|uniref:Thermostable monoacylglycerol lipase n=1 Tax=Actibacterium lipolyticum TaxID=1524263 RepID=A0A238KMW9_9RHOB|nr:alpha/beta fold hydrolase [Actibacterium lipolyticum]SMX43522.1 Thermostable monoacylglycerol lipase [Actibacterium lipolyticum]